MLNLILIALIVVYIIDISGFVQSMKRLALEKIFHAQNVDPSKVNWKPFDCSRCMTWWTTLIWLACTGSFTLEWIAAAAMLSMLTPQIAALLQLVCDIVSTIETVIGKKISKL